MGVDKIIKQYTLGSFNKYAKDLKKKYKDENNKPLMVNVAEYITFGQIVKPNLFGTSNEVSLREPDIDMVVPLVILGNTNYSETEALNDIKLYLDENEDLGIKGLMLELMVKLFKDLKISPEATKRAVELRDKYIDDKAVIENKDTQDE